MLDLMLLLGYHFPAEHTLGGWNNLLPPLINLASSIF